ncbi:uncharacterized protein Non2 isoform X1 [Neodiprion pinetum]|uniref:Upstream activation factor subunit spp27 isoform X2 n=1 Tax=Neodiprion lecontei TaxID=441921 RepID=A0ABM3FV77_NEOLC|nr:upstream activation factor subunit spp27 isoform X2 [Neodiprion pinetum]XP_046591920.1 upstream activation factor subunit spp27 isoform X2 [Neodiprion lecontei]
MADISKDELRKEITAILKDADLTTMSAKKVRQQIEEKLDVDLTDRKKEVDDLVMECLQEKQDSGKKNKKGKAASEESEEGEEEEEEGSEEEEEEEEKKPAKRTPAKKTATKRKKGSSDDEESASDDDASDEEYSPKKPKPTPKKGITGKPGKKGKKKGSDSDSDEDWGKSKKAAGGAKKGAGKGKGGGYTRAVTLSPELASVVGAEQMARHEVVKKVWSIIKERNLYDPKNKQFAICDEELLKVIGVKRFRTFGMMKYLKNHFVD